MGVDYSNIPEHCREGLRAYVEEGTPVGDFLRCVLTNDLVGSFARADVVNRAHMWAYVAWLYNEAPGQAWGDLAHYKAWIERGGLKGKPAEAPQALVRPAEATTERE